MRVSQNVMEAMEECLEKCLSTIQSYNLDYEEIGMHDISREERQALMQKTNNYRTVPQIFIGDTFVGGFDELNQMNQQGKLDELLAG